MIAHAGASLRPEYTSTVDRPLSDPSTTPISVLRPPSVVRSVCRQFLRAHPLHYYLRHAGHAIAQATCLVTCEPRCAGSRCRRAARRSSARWPPTEPLPCDEREGVDMSVSKGAWRGLLACVAIKARIRCERNRHRRQHAALAAHPRSFLGERAASGRRRRVDSCGRCRHHAVETLQGSTQHQKTRPKIPVCGTKACYLR